MIIGAGPAGLTAAYMLTKRGATATILEADDIVGGISRTVERDGWRFDIGGHRFFTKVTRGRRPLVRDPRRGRVPPAAADVRILYRGKLYDYPLKPMNALTQPRARRGGALRRLVRLGQGAGRRRTQQPRGVLREPVRLAALRALLPPYNEKVWGVPTTEMSADFGAQRSKGMSLMTRRSVDALTPKWVKARARARASRSRSLIESFNYPKYGPGQMWEKCRRDRHRQRAASSSSTPRSTGSRTATAPRTRSTADGRRLHERAFPCTHVISSMPFRSLHPAMDPPVPDRRPGRGRRAHVPRLHHRRARRAAGVLVPRQLDLHPRPRGQGRPDPELRVVVAVPREGRPDLSRARVLRERGRHDVDQVRRGPRRAGQARAATPRPRGSSEGRGRLRGADAEGVSGLRRALPGQRRGAARAGSPTMLRT